MDTLSSLRIGDLNSKLIDNQKRRFELFVQKASEVKSLTEVLEVSNPAYRREAVELADQITLHDLQQFSEGTYFDESLFFATF